RRTGARRDRRRAEAPGVRAAPPRQPDRGLRARLGDRHREDGDARDRAGGARADQVPSRRAGALRRLRQPSQRPGAAGPARRRRRTGRRRLARRGIVHGDLRNGGTALPLVALVILDGWGCAPPGPGNAVELADTPVFDGLWERYPHTTLKASGEAVGLPPAQLPTSP